MKKGLKIVIVTALALVLLALAGFWLYRHFVADRIMDGGGGMQNPDAVQILDGDYTYVDNSILWAVLEGTWKSAEGRWQAVVSEESGIALMMDGEAVLKGELHFTYLQPGEVLQTEFYLDDYTLRTPDLKSLGEITYLCHEAGDGGSGTLRIEMDLSGGTEETVKLKKTEEPPQI